MRRSHVGALLTAVMVVSACGVGQPSAGSQAPDQSGDSWTTVFADDFSGVSLDRSHWNTCYWWGRGGCTIATNNELEWYQPAQVSVADGQLRLTAIRSATTGSDGRSYGYRSGMVSTGPAGSRGPAKFAFTYGIVTARLQVPEGHGLWAALWLLPASRQSLPEIDLMEVVGSDPSMLLMHLHPAERNAETLGQTYTLPSGSFASGMHDLELNWQPDELSYSVDGAPVWQINGDQVPSQPMYLIANLAVGGDYPGPPSASTRFPATFRIDDIRVLQQAR